MTAPDGMRHGRVKDAASYEIFTHSPLCVSKRSPVRRGGTHRCRPTNMDGLPHMVCGAGTSSGTVRHKAAVLHPLWGGDGGLRLCRGLRPLRRALRDDGVFRWLRPAGVSRRARRDRGAAPGPRDFGLPAARWQEWSARNFSSEQGVGSQPYWMYGKKPHRSYGGKGPASTADTRVAGSPVRKKSSKTFIFVLLRPFRDGNCCFTSLSIFRSCRRRTCWLRREPAPAHRPWTGWPDGTAWSGS